MYDFLITHYSETDKSDICLCIRFIPSFWASL